jgi:GT2 family glycosyltransferase
VFAPHDPTRRVEILVVALGATDRLQRCLESLVAHQSRHAFGVICVVNPDNRVGQPCLEAPAGVRVMTPQMNLGWAGGLHLARAQTSAPYLVWSQDDMVVTPGWLDALVDTADDHPDAGAVGSIEVDDDGLPNGFAAGFAVPVDDVRRWNDTEALRAGADIADRTFDWVTSKGLLTRSAAWDAVHGTDPRLFPLNHVDKDYSAHLRCHGWTLRVAPGAHLVHEGQRSATPVIRGFLADWQEPAFNARWGTPLGALGPGIAADVPHECATWDSSDFAGIERLIGIEASRMVVASARFAADHERRRVEMLEEAIRGYRESTSWRLSTPIRLVGQVLRHRRAGDKQAENPHRD